MKKIELTPEWVLEKFPEVKYSDGNGNVSLYADEVISVHFIVLALKTINIHYEYHEWLDEDDELYTEFNFRLESIRNTCPSFYKRMREMDISNNHWNLSKN